MTHRGDSCEVVASDHVLRILGQLVDASATANVDELSADMWQQLLTIARRGRVLGFVAQALSRASLPVEVRHALAAGLMQSVELQQLWLRRFATVNAAFERAHLAVIPLKGIALTQTIYRDLPFRVMGDIDLLIAPEDVGEAARLLQAQGFAPEKPNIHRFHDAISARHPGGLTGRVTLYGPSFSVDLHVQPRYAVAERFRTFDAAGARRRAIVWPQLGKNVSLLSPVDELALLTLHAIDRADPACVQLLDVALALRQSGLSPQDAAELVPLTKPSPIVRRELASFLHEVGALFSPSPPASLLARFAPFFTRPQHFAPPLQLWERTSEMAYSERLLYLVGYLLPNPNAYAGSGFQQLREHTRHFARRLYHRATRSNPKEN